MNPKKSLKDSSDFYLNNFSHIYIEKSVLNHPETARILEKLKGREIITIDNYKDVFNRPRQNFEFQKNSRKLILAEKKNDFFYNGSYLCEDFGEKNFYYSSSIYNCIYDCEYCYLKGLYPTANVVIFVNTDDYFNAISKEAEGRNIYLCISYDSDLLTFEPLTGFIKRWVEFAKENKNIKIEIRTKSAGFKYIKDLEIPENIIFAWTVLPQYIISGYEKHTPQLDERIESMICAINAGHKVRLSIEPLIKVPDFEKVYKDFVDYIFSKIDESGIRDVNIGAFRMNAGQFKNIKKLNRTSKIFSYPFTCSKGYETYEDANYMKEFVKSCVVKYISKDKVY